MINGLKNKYKEKISRIIPTNDIVKYHFVLEKKFYDD